MSVPASVHPVKFGPFVTRAVIEGIEGIEHAPVLLTSRRHRKQLRPLRLLASAGLDHEPIPRKDWLRFWAPDRLSWWIAILFIIGSFLFAIAAAPSLWPLFFQGFLGQNANPISNVTYFVGSLFFTSAASLQLFQSMNSDISRVGEGRGTKWVWWAWRPRNLGYLASLIQFVGTLLFNLNTGSGLVRQTHPDWAIWVPNMTGSICFLVASLCAYLEIAHRVRYFALNDLTFWIAVINGLGSVAFQISAFASYVDLNGQLLDAAVSNWGTFLGALCFLAASYLLIPEMFEKSSESGSSIQSSDAASHP
ncbi:MAG: hypothetical protein P8N76_06155 [Pirellulaceae bacterium]|nr:hypothetical protein [Pirellulaceae bacterium]